MNAIVSKINTDGVQLLSRAQGEGSDDPSYDKIVTPSFIEAERIISPENAEAKQLAGLMQSLAQQLLGNRYDPAKHQFKFLFSDKPDPNGFIIPKATPPIIVTTTDLIKGAKSIDEIAGYLAHELGHLYIEEEFGKQRKRNSKAEETAADLYSMKALIDAGYSPQGVTNLIRRFKGSESSWKALADVHPLDGNRLSILEKTKVVMARDGYDTSQAVRAVPTEWSVVKDMGYISPLEQKQKDDGYDRMKPEDKLRWISSEAEALNTEWSKDRDIRTIDVDTVRSRIQALHKMYHDVSIDSRLTSQAEAVHETFNTFMRCDMMQAGLYEETLRKLGAFPKHGKWPLIGELRDMQKHIDAFLAAENATEAETAAKAMRSSYYSGGISSLYRVENNENRFDNDKPPFQDRLAFKEIELPTLAILSKQTQSAPVELPISKHLQWLKETKNESIATAIKMIGGEALIKVIGGRVPWGDPVGHIIHVPRLDSDPKTTEEQTAKEYTTSLIVNEQAKVSGIVEPVKFSQKLPSLPDDTTPEEFQRSFRSYARERANWERSLLSKGISWSLLENDPIRFTEIYGAALLPTLSFERVEHPFAQAVAEKVQALRKTDPEKATETANILEHFLGRGGSNEQYSSNIPKNLSKTYRIGIDPDHPFVKLFLSFVDHSKKGEKYRSDLNFIHNDMMQHVRYTDVFERQKPLSESHLCFSREEMEYESGGTYILIGSIGNEFRATDIAKELQAKGTSFTLKDALAYNASIASLPEDNTLKNWLTDAIKAPLNSAKERFYAQPLEVQIQEFQNIDRGNYFVDTPVLRNEVIGKILDKIGTLPDPVKRQEATLALLYKSNDKSASKTVDVAPKIKGFFAAVTGNRKDEYHCMLSLPDQREAASRFIADGIQAAHGTDDGSDTYAKHLTPVVDDLFIKTTGMLRLQIMGDLCERVNSQTALSKYVEDKLPREAFLDLAKNDPAFRVGEFLKAESEYDDKLRYAVINFLANTYDKTRAGRIYALAANRIREDNDYGVSRYEPAFVEQLADMHANFWNAPMAARAGLLHDYLFDRHRGNATASGMIDQILNRAIGKDSGDITPVTASSEFEKFLSPYEEQMKIIEEKLAEKRDAENWKELPQRQRIQRALIALGKMPEAYKLGGELLKRASVKFPGYGAALIKRYARYQLGLVGAATPMTQEELSHLTLKSYLNTVEQEEAQLLAAALLVASNERGEGDALGIGKTLNLVLSNMGPAGAKMLQAVHSHPSTPEHIRDELKDSKVDHEKPYRFHVVGWANDAGLSNPDNPDRATYLGPIKGAGSFGVTMFNTDADGNTVADTLLRPRAAEKASREFQLMGKAGKVIAQRDSRMEPVISMIGEAERSARIETKMPLAAKQNEVAQQVYNGVTVHIAHSDGSSADFTHRVMPLLSHSAKHKRVAIAHGPHFNDLADDLEHANPSYKQDAAIAVIAPQMIARFAGLPVDRDRHGGNIKLDNETIQHFDLGAMELVLPTTEQKQALGKVVAQAVKDVGIKGGDFTSNLVNRVDKFSASKDTKNFLAGFLREMLALGDYRNAGVDEDKLKGILGLALYGENVDRQIQTSFKRELGVMIEPKVRKELQTAAASAGITVKGIKNSSAISMPNLTDEELKLFNTTEAKAPTHLLAYLRGAQQQDRSRRKD